MGDGEPVASRRSAAGRRLASPRPRSLSCRSLGSELRCVQCVVPHIIDAPGASKVDLRHLRAFVTIVDAGGFGRAVARLNLSQPALSRQIRALEAELDVQLFDRIGRRVQLTAEGEDLLRRARGLLTDADSLGERARALKGGQVGVLRVGATPQAMETLLAGFLPRYRRGTPGLRSTSSRMAAPVWPR